MPILDYFKLKWNLGCSGLVFQEDEGHEQVVKCIVPAFRAVNQISNSQPLPEASLSSLCDVSNLLCVYLDLSHGGLDTGIDSPRPHASGCEATFKVLMDTTGYNCGS